MLLPFNDRDQLLKSLQLWQEAQYPQYARGWRVTVYHDWRDSQWAFYFDRTNDQAVQEALYLEEGIRQIFSPPAWTRFVPGIRAWWKGLDIFWHHRKREG